MKPICIIFGLYLLFFNHLMAQNPSWMWTKTAGGSQADYGRSVVTDDEGNVYQTGHFNNAIITFGSVVLQNSNPGFSEIFVTKYNPSGAVIWAKTIQGAGSDYVYSICEDSKGHIYLAGSFDSDTLSIDSVAIQQTAFMDMFIIQLDTNGNAQWMRSEYGTFNEVAYAVAADNFGNAFLTGLYESPSWVLGGDTITNHGSEDVFLVKYDSLGNLLWAKGAGGGSYDTPTGIATDSNGSVVVTGSFKSFNFISDSDTIINHGVATDDVFLIKYDALGNLQWARSVGGTASDHATCVTTDVLSNIIVGGYFYSPFVKIGGDSLSSAGKSDMLLAKFNAQGNPIWARKIGGIEIDEINSIDVDQQSNIIVAGNFGSPQLNFANNTLLNNGNMDIIIARFDKNGSPHSAQSIGNSKDDIVLSIDCDSNNRIVLTGYYFSLILTFGSNTIFNSGTSFFPEAYIAKLDSTSIVVSGLNSKHKANFISLYPNPTQRQVNVSFALQQSSDVDLEIFSITGEYVLQRKLGYYLKGNLMLPIQLGELSQGVYFVRLTTKDGIMIGKLIVAD